MSSKTKNLLLFWSGLFVLLALGTLTFSKPLALMAIRIYQSQISPIKGYRCAHLASIGEHSCSEFGYRAVDYNGLLKGSILILQRFRECSAISESVSPIRLSVTGGGTDEVANGCGRLTFSFCKGCSDAAERTEPREPENPSKEISDSTQRQVSKKNRLILADTMTEKGLASGEVILPYIKGFALGMTMNDAALAANKLFGTGDQIEVYEVAGMVPVLRFQKGISNEIESRESGILDTLKRVGSEVVGAAKFQVKSGLNIRSNTRGYVDSILFSPDLVDDVFGARGMSSEAIHNSLHLGYKLQPFVEFTEVRVEGGPKTVGYESITGKLRVRVLRDRSVECTAATTEDSIGFTPD